MRRTAKVNIPLSKGIRTNIDDLQISSMGLVDLVNLRHEQAYSVESTPFYKKVSEPPQDILKLTRLDQELLGFSWDKLYKIQNGVFEDVGDYLNARVDTFSVGQSSHDLIFPDLYIDYETKNIHTIYRGGNRMTWKKVSPTGGILREAERDVDASLGKGKEKILICSVQDRPIVVRLANDAIQFFFPEQNFATANITYASVLNSYTGTDAETVDISLSVENEGGPSERAVLKLYLKSGQTWNTYEIKFKDQTEFLATRFSSLETGITYSKEKNAPEYMPCLRRFAYWGSFVYSGKNYHLVWNANNGYYLLDDNQKILGKFSHNLTHSNPLGVDWDYSGTIKVIGDEIYFPVLLNSDRQITEGNFGFSIENPVGVYIVKLRVDKEKFVCDIDEVNNNLILASPALKFYDGQRLSEFGFCETPDLNLLTEGISQSTINFIHREVDAYLSVVGAETTMSEEIISRFASGVTHVPGTEIRVENGNLVKFMFDGVNIDLSENIAREPNGNLLDYNVSNDYMSESGELVRGFGRWDEVLNRGDLDSQGEIEDLEIIVTSSEQALRNRLEANDNLLRSFGNTELSRGVDRNAYILGQPYDYLEDQRLGSETSDVERLTFNGVFIATDNTTGRIIAVVTCVAGGGLAPSNRTGRRRFKLECLDLTSVMGFGAGAITGISKPPNASDYTIRAYRLSSADVLLWDERSNLSNNFPQAQPQNTLALLGEPEKSSNTNASLGLIGGISEVNNPTLTHFYQEGSVLNVGITFEPTDPNFIANADDWITSLQVTIRESGEEDIEISTRGVSPALVFSSAERVEGTNTWIYKFNYTQPTGGEITTEKTYNLLINREVADDIFVPREGEALFSFNFDGEEYDVEGVEFQSRSAGSYVELTLNRSPQFSSSDLIASLTIEKQKTQFGSVSITGRKVRFENNGDITNADEEAVNVVLLELLKPSSGTSDEQEFENIYEYSACYRWKDNKGKSHYSRASEISNLTIKNYLGKNETSATLQASALNLSEKDGVVEIVLFRRLSEQDPVDTELTVVPYPFREDTASVNRKCIGTSTPVENISLTSDKEDDDLLIGTWKDYLRSIFQPEGAEACRIQHECLYIGGLNQNKTQIVQSQPADLAYADFFSFAIDNTAVLNVRHQFNHKVLRLANLDSALVIFTERGIERKVGRNATPNTIVVGEKNYLTNKLSVVETYQGVVFETLKGIHILDRSNSAKFWGWDIHRIAVSDPVVQTYSAVKAHEIFFILQSEAVLSYNLLYQKWSSWNTAKTITDFDDEFYIIDGAGDLMVSSPDNEQTKDHILETGWFNFEKPHGTFYLKGINLLGDFRGFNWLKWQLYYNNENEARETKIVRNNPSFLDKPAGLARFSIDLPRPAEPKIYKNMRVEPKIQKIDSLKLKITINGNTIKISNLGFDVLPIYGENRQKSEGQTI